MARCQKYCSTNCYERKSQGANLKSLFSAEHKTQRNKNPTKALKTADGRTKVKLLEGVHLGPDLFAADVDAVPEPDRVAGPVVEGEPHLEVVNITNQFLTFQWK